MVQANDRFYGRCRITKNGFIQILRYRAASTVLGERDPGEYYDAYIAEKIDPLFVAAIFLHESSMGKAGWAMKTLSWGNTRPPAFGPQPSGVYDQDSGKFYSWEESRPSGRRYLCAYSSWLNGCRSTVARLASDTYPVASPYRRRTIGGVFNDPSGAVWAPAGDQNDPEGYLSKVLSFMTQYQDTDISIGGGTVPVATVEERFLAEMQRRGLFAQDNRGRLPINPIVGNRYGPYRNGLASIQYLAQHWTGDAFTEATGPNIPGGVSLPGGLIPETMTLDDEMDMLRWYANYHISRDGGVWGGIAYTIMVFPSGRIYLNWNFNTLTYHAFNANAVAMALCCPNSRGAQPTQKALVSINHVWQWLTHECPEIPADYSKLYGHKELTFIDARNTTTCPGTYLPHVQRFRADGKPTVDITIKDATPVDPQQAYNDAQKYRQDLLKAAAEGIDYKYRGNLASEGWLNLSSMPAPHESGASDERFMEFDKIVLHTINGRVESMMRTGPLSFDALMSEHRLGRW